MARMADQEIAIHLRIIVGCLKFFMRYLSFWHNQIYKPSRIYNENEQQVYNEMHTDEW